MPYTPDHIAQRCAEISTSFMESMVRLGIPQGSGGLYADYFSWNSGKKSSPREETCATSIEYQPLARELAADPLRTAFTLEHVRTFQDELDFLQDLEVCFLHVKNGFTDGLRRCVDLHRCIPSATVTDVEGKKLRQSNFETRFVASKKGGTDAVSIQLSIEYSSSEIYHETGEMEVCRMSLAHFLDKDAFEDLLLAGLAEMLECREREAGGTASSQASESIGSDTEQNAEDLLASQDYLRLAELINDRAIDMDFTRIQGLVAASLQNIMVKSEAISRQAESVDITDTLAIEEALQAISMDADTVFNAATFLESALKALSVSRNS